MKIYTKTGDSGTTSLIGGERVAKYDSRVEAYGTVDELSAVAAYLRDSMDQVEWNLIEYRDDLRNILNTLMDVEANLAVGDADTNKVPSIRDEAVSYLEDRIDYIQNQLAPIDKFTLPGGHPFVSLAHWCRTVCRRAERDTVRAMHDFPVNPNTAIYLNRLSDYFYQLGRKLAQEMEVKEEFWDPRV